MFVFASLEDVKCLRWTLIRISDGRQHKGKPGNEAVKENVFSPKGQEEHFFQRTYVSVSSIA